MPTFRLTENESVDTDDVAKVDYLPAAATDFVTELLAEETAGDVVNPASPSQLTILLKSGCEITLTGDDADAIWARLGAVKPTNRAIS
jgi:hypothetical protein